MLSVIPLSSPHVHTTYCDGLSTAEEMVRSALGHGFVSIGLSSHGRQDFDPLSSMDAGREALYIRDAAHLRSAYAGRIRVWLGVERDFYSVSDRSLFDYVIASVHYLFINGRRMDVDGDPLLLERDLRHCLDGDGLRFAREYYALLGRYVCGYKPDIIGHFDVVTKNNPGGRWFDPLGGEYLAIAKEALDRARRGCDLLEVNTGGMARYGESLPRPSLPLLDHWRRLGGRVILSSDCHDAKDIAYGYETALTLVREAGYTEITSLGTGDRLFETSAL